MKVLLLALATLIGGCIGVTQTSSVVLIREDNTAEIDVTPGQRLDVLMLPPYSGVLERCENMGGTEVIFYPNTGEYICPKVDF